MREFLKWMAASAIGTVIGLVAFAGLLGVGATGFLVYLLTTGSEDPEPEVEPSSLLVFDLSTQIRDGVPPSGASVVLEETLSGSSSQAISIYQAVRAIRAAADDDAIAGLYLYGNSGAGLATLDELRQAIADFQAADKPVIAYEVGWSERDYFLTSIADTVMLDSAGLLEFNGFQAEMQFLAGAFEKYGIGVQVLRAGRYKSAVEPFVRTTISPEEREQTQALLGSLWQGVLTAVGESRTQTSADLQGLANAGGLLMAADAQAAGLVDETAFYDTVLETLQGITGDEASVGEDITSIDLVAYSRVARSRETKSRNVVAIVYAEGEIVLGSGGEGLIGSDDLARTLRDLRLDDAVKAVVLRINSPGGGATASEQIADAVRRLQAEKPVIVSMGNLAASGGYMMAAAGDRIFASASTITGSIGVFGLLLNLQDIGNRNGVTWDVVKTAPFADIGTLARPQNPQELALQQSVVDTLYDRFITLVAEGRDMPEAQVDAVAQGRVWSGTDAQTAGLVDDIGGIEAAIAYAADQADLDTWQVKEYPQPRSLESQILDSLFGEIMGRLPGARTPFLGELATLHTQLSLLDTLNDPHGIYMRLPFTTLMD